MDTPVSHLLERLLAALTLSFTVGLCHAVDAVRVEIKLKDGCPGIEQECPNPAGGSSSGDYWRLALPSGSGGTISANNLPIYKRLLASVYSKKHAVSGILSAQIGGSADSIKALPLFGFASTNGSSWTSTTDSSIVEAVTVPFERRGTGVVSARFKVLMSEDVNSDAVKVLVEGTKLLSQFASAPQWLLKFVVYQDKVKAASELETKIETMFFNASAGDKLIKFHPEAVASINFVVEGEDGKSGTQIFTLRPQWIASVFPNMPRQVPRQVDALQFAYEMPGAPIMVKVPEVLADDLKAHLKAGSDLGLPIAPALCVELDQNLRAIGLSAQDRAIVAAGFLDAVFWTETLTRRDAGDLCFNRFRQAWSKIDGLKDIQPRSALKQENPNRNLASIGDGKLQDLIASVFRPDADRAKRLSLFGSQVQIGASADPSVVVLLPRVADPDDLSAQSTNVLVDDFLDHVLGAEIVYEKPAGMSSCIRPLGAQSTQVLRIACLRYNGRRLVANITFTDNPMEHAGAKIKGVVFDKLL